MKLLPAAPLISLHKTAAFTCDEPVLDEWLKRLALAKQTSGASRTYVVTDDTQQVRATARWLQAQWRTKRPHAAFARTCQTRYPSWCWQGWQ